MGILDWFLDYIAIHVISQGKASSQRYKSERNINENIFAHWNHHFIPSTGSLISRSPLHGCAGAQPWSLGYLFERQLANQRNDISCIEKEQRDHNCIRGKPNTCFLEVPFVKLVAFTCKQCQEPQQAWEYEYSLHDRKISEAKGIDDDECDITEHGKLQ